MYLRRAPRAAALADFVESIEYVQDSPGSERERMIPNGEVSIVITLVDDGFTYLDGGEHRAPGACLTGPRRSAQVISTRPQRGMVAINFKPAGAVPFLPVPLQAAAETYLPLADVWGRDGALVRERLLGVPPKRTFDLIERILLDQVAKPLERDLAVDLAVRALDRGELVRDVVDRFGTTSKPFIRRFTQAIGLTPKRYSRLRRIQHLLHALPPDGDADWAALAVEQGFYDQSHLIHDFAEVTGVLPSQYRPRTPDEVNHLPC
jgi:AraC-like DNA-binding protein